MTQKIFGCCSSPIDTTAEKKNTTQNIFLWKPFFVSILTAQEDDFDIISENDLSLEKDLSALFISLAFDQFHSIKEEKSWTWLYHSTTHCLGIDL